MADTITKALQEALAALDHATDAQSNPKRREFPTIHDFGQMRRAADGLRAALAAKEQDQAEPWGYAVLAENGNTIVWTRDKKRAEDVAANHGRPVTELWDRPPAAQPVAVPADPMDWPLPCDVTVGHVTIKRGCNLGALVLRMKALYWMATGTDADAVAARTLEERQALFAESPLAAAPAAPVVTSDEPHRTDAQIVAQTEELAAALNDWRWGGMLEHGTYRESTNPKAQWCWEMACKAQEILTDTDVERAHGIGQPAGKGVAE